MNKKILIVEDTLEALENLVDFLRLEGFDVSGAADGEKAKNKLRTFTPDLIITDMQMPNMDGFDFIGVVKKIDNLKSIPIIVFSANASQENELKCLQSGAALFLKKPCPNETILESILYVLNKPNPQSNGN